MRGGRRALGEFEREAGVGDSAQGGDMAIGDQDGELLHQGALRCMIDHRELGHLANDAVGLGIVEMLEQFRGGFGADQDHEGGCLLQLRHGGVIQGVHA